MFNSLFQNLPRGRKAGLRNFAIKKGQQSSTLAAAQGSTFDVVAVISSNVYNKTLLVYDLQAVFCN